MSGSVVNQGGDSDNLDSGFRNLKITGGSPHVVPQATEQQLKERYNMNYAKRGHFIIINNRAFDPATGMSERAGTDRDRDNLYSTFKYLGFNVKVHNNLTAFRMMEEMQKVAALDHTDCDCVAIAILSHGEQGLVYGTDNIIEIDKLINPFKECKSLAGKPKLFFIQACRGTELDAGTEVETDADPVPARQNLARIPMEADFLYAYSTTPGYFSWRNSSKGSWFVQALCRVLSERAYSDIDLGRMMTRVNYIVAYEFESNAAQAHMTRKKQASSTVSMLTKDVYFTRK